uniref:Putative secreted peptide n=1 Tax=Anopheles braziliensis TaxID=58242 RepID=A0A2M3ZVI8_9DIPT
MTTFSSFKCAPLLVMVLIILSWLLLSIQTSSFFTDVGSSNACSTSYPRLICSIWVNFDQFKTELTFLVSCSNRMAQIRSLRRCFTLFKFTIFE